MHEILLQPSAGILILRRAFMPRGGKNVSNGRDDDVRVIEEDVMAAAVSDDLFADW